MKKIILLVILAFIAVVVYQILHNDGKEIPEVIQTASKVQIIDTLNLGVLNFDTINPIKSHNEHIQQISKLVFDSLFNITSNFKIEPGLATEYTKIDSKVYIIKIRDNVYWHDNSILISNDIENVINEIKSDNNSIYYNNVQNIKNVKIIDENTIRFELYEKDVFFEYNLIFPIVKNDSIGTGKYMVKNNQLEFNKLYWKEINPTIQNINIKQYDNMRQMYIDFKNNDIDIINTKEIDYKNILNNISYNKKEYLGRNQTYIELNNIEKEVRQTIYYAINKNEIISKVYNSTYYNIDFPLDTIHWLYKGNSIYKYDLEKAIYILEENGWIYDNSIWKKDKEILEINILVESNDKIKNDISYIIKNQLEKIGIKVNVEKVSKNLYNYYLKKKNYDIIINTKRIGLSPNLDGYFIENEFVEKIENANNEREIINIYLKIQENYEQDLPFICLCCNKETMIFTEKIHGSITPNWYNIFYDIENWKKINKNS